MKPVGACLLVLLVVSTAPVAHNAGGGGGRRPEPDMIPTEARRMRRGVPSGWFVVGRGGTQGALDGPLHRAHRSISSTPCWSQGVLKSQVPQVKKKQIRIAPGHGSANRDSSVQEGHHTVGDGIAWATIINARLPLGCYLFAF